MEQQTIAAQLKELRRLCRRSGMPLRLVTLLALATFATNQLAPLEFRERLGDIDAGAILALLVCCVLFELNTWTYIRRRINAIERAVLPASVGSPS